MSDIVLRTEGLTKRFGPVIAVDTVDLAVRAGEVYGFLGPNGAGKTTTIAMALGLLHPTAGRVEVLGQRVTPGHTKALRRVGSLVGVPGMVPALSGRRNLKLLARLHPDVDDRRVEEILDFVSLSDAADRKYKGYSLGMRQRLGLAAALLHRPALLILDEPTNGLDPAGMREVRDLLQELAVTGTTVFLSSHLLHEVEQICDRVAVLNSGSVVAEGPVRELLRGSRVVRARVSSTRAALAALEGLPGMTCVEANGRSVVVHGASSEAVIVRLVEKGVVPSEVTTGETDLESVFLSLTQAAA
jgi:ABC-type multidrug transport system ATPase subunit